MRNYKTTFLLLINLLLGLQLFAQTDSSYIYLDDPSGIRPSGSERIALEEAADSLVARIPSAYRDSFIVIETDIYPILHYTKEGSEEIWDRLKIKANQRKKYHLLLAKEFDNNGLVDIRWQLVLPKGSPFDCIDSTKSQIFFQEMNFEILRKKFSYDNIIRAIDILEEHFAEFLFTGFSSNCAYCPQKVGGLRYRLESLGFTGKPVRKIRVYGNGATESGYTYNKKVVVYPLADMDSIDIYNDQLSWQSELSSAMEDVYSEFTYYKTDGTGCEDLDKPLAIKNSGQLDIRDNQSYIYKNEVVVLDGGEGDSWVYVKEESKLDNIPDFPKGTIHVVLLPGTGLDINQLIDKINYFYDLIDIHPNVMKYKWGGIPKRIGIPDLSKKDAITVIGKRVLEVATYVKETYNNLLSDGFIATDISSDGFVNNPNNLERGDSWGIQLISIVKTESMTSSLLQDFKCPGDMVKLTAFLVFHATGHNAGIRHNNTNSFSEADGYGYMDDGNEILWMLGKEKYKRPEFVPKLYSLDDLITLTKDKYPNMLEKIKIKYE